MPDRSAIILKEVEPEPGHGEAEEHAVQKREKGAKGLKRLHMITCFCFLVDFSFSHLPMAPAADR
jgi:hypothetical protein